MPPPTLSPLLADQLRAQAEANRQKIGLADILRSGPPIYEAMSNPNFARGVADAPSLLGYASSPSFAGLRDVLGVAQRAVDETPTGVALNLLGLIPAVPPGAGRLALQALGDEAGILRGPAAYAIRRASPALGRYLERRPEMVYARFGDDLAAAAGADSITTGETKLFGPEGARRQSFIHDFVGSLSNLPRVSSIQSGALERGMTFPNPYRPPLPRPLEPGDIEVILDREMFDPTVFRPTSKSAATLREQRETAIHEGLHAAFLARLTPDERRKLGGLWERFRQGETLSPLELNELRTALPTANMPVAAILTRHPESRAAIFDWLGSADYDFLKMLSGAHDLGHAALEVAAHKAARTVPKR